LVAGSVYNYSGTYSETITYASPSPTQPNSDGTYTIAEVEKVVGAGSTAPAPFDVQRTLTYTVTKAPVSGIQLAKRTISTFEASTVTSTSQTITETQGTSTSAGINLNAGLQAGNGPYAYTDSTTTAYASPLTLQVFPLQTGATRTQPLARTATSTGESINAAKDVFASHNTTTDYNNDGSYTETGTIGTGEQTSVVAASNGTAVTTNTGKTTFKQTIGLPALASGAYTIPVARVNDGKTTTYSAADWYPGNALPPTPLASTTQTVKGPISVPASCGVTAPAPNPELVQTASTTLDVTGSLSNESAQTYFSNGTVVCRANTTTTMSFNVTTGVMNSTTVGTFSEGLTSSSVPASQERSPI
jgi:hypothetical protein